MLMKELAKKVLRIVEVDVIFNTQGYSIKHQRLDIGEFSKRVEDICFKPYLSSNLSESYFARCEENKRKLSKVEPVLFWDRAVAIENYIKQNLNIKAEHDTFSCVTFNAIHYNQTFSIYKDIKNLLLFKTTITDENIDNVQLYEDVVSI